MAELNLDQDEIGVVLMALTAIEDTWLNEDGKAAQARLAYKLCGAAADMLTSRRAALEAEEIMPDPGPGMEWYRELYDENAGTP